VPEREYWAETGTWGWCEELSDPERAPSYGTALSAAADIERNLLHPGQAELESHSTKHLRKPEASGRRRGGRRRRRRRRTRTRTRTRTRRTRTRTRTRTRRRRRRRKKSGLFAPTN